MFSTPANILLLNVKVNDQNLNLQKILLHLFSNILGKVITGLIRQAAESLLVTVICSWGKKKKDKFSFMMAACALVKM